MSRYCKIRCKICNKEIGSLELPEGDITIISDVTVKDGLSSDIDLLVDSCDGEHSCEDCGWLSASYNEGEADGFQAGKQEGFLKGLKRMTDILENTLKHKGRTLFSEYSWIFDPVKKEYDNVIDEYYKKDIPDLACKACSEFEVGVSEGRTLGIAEGHIIGHDRAIVFLMTMLIELSQEDDLLSVKKIIDALCEEGILQEKKYTDLKTKIETITTLS